MIPFLSEQIRLLYSIASLRNAELDPFFLFLNYIDSEYFLLGLIPVVWIAVSPKWGIRLAVLLIINTALNYYLKFAFGLPRPIVDFPSLSMLPYTTPGFPSGAAQMSTLLGGLLIYGWKRPVSWVVGIGFAMLMCFSRLYLGVHYPMDIIGGVVVGLLLFFAFVYSVNPVEKFCKKQGGAFCVILTAILCFLYSFLRPPL